MTPLHETAASLLEIIWRGVPRDYKSRYRMSIWQQFEDNIRSAAYTSNLGKFINSLCMKLGATLGRNASERGRVETILNGGQDRELLKLMREETTLLVLMVRVRTQERREAWKERQSRLPTGRQLGAEALEDPDLLDDGGS